MAENSNLPVDELRDLLRTLSPNQIEFVEKRLIYPTDAEAMAHCKKISRETLQRWKRETKIMDCIRLAKMDGIEVAREKLRRLAGRAVHVLADELETKKGSAHRAQTAFGILDRLGLIATSGIDITSQGKPLKLYIGVSPDDWDDNSEV